MPISRDQQVPLVDRLYEMCGGTYSPEERRKYWISCPQWAVAYEGNAVFHAPTRDPITFQKVIEEVGKAGIRAWTTHDTDVISADDLFTERQDETVAAIKQSLADNGVECSMVTCETFHHPVFSASAAAESPEIRAYAQRKLNNTVTIGHELGAQFVVYWPGTLGYMIQGAIEETETLKWFAEGLNGACEHDIAEAEKRGRAPMKHCMEAKPFEPASQIILPSSDAMLAFISSGLLSHPEMVGLNPEYLHELMWGAACRAALARAMICGKLFHFDINDGYPLKHDVDMGVGLINPLDWVNVLVLLRSHGFEGPFNLDYKPPRTTSNYGVFKVSMPSCVDRFITLWNIAGEVLEDPVMKEATGALKQGGGGNPEDLDDVVAANRELLTLHELIAHRLFQLLVGQHRGRVYSG